ncbi:flippase [Halosegnis sp.]|uniref:flippase n=1 Tax=Halosegnis sp. TaxID=2864959 RepID=UPI0035D438D1
MSDDRFGAIRTVFTGGTVLVAGLVLELGTAFVGKLVLAIVYGKTSYGELSLGITLLTTVSLLVVVGLDRGIGRYLPRTETPAARRGLLVTGLRIVVGVSLVATVAVFVAAPTLARVFDTPESTRLLRIFALGIPFAALMRYAVGGIQGLQKTLPRALIQNITLPVVRFLGILVAVGVAAGSLGVAVAYVLAYLLAGLAGLVYIARETSVFDRSVAWSPQYRELLSFSAPLVVTAAMAAVLSDVDIFMLGALVGPSPVGIYNVVYPLANLLDTGLVALGFIFMPVFSELHDEGRTEDMRRTFQVATKWVVTGTLPLFLLFVFHPQLVITLTFTAEYAEGAQALAILAIGFFLPLLGGFNASALTSIGRTRAIMYDNVIVAALNVGLNIVLIPRYSFLGAAIATAVSYGLLNVLYAIQLYRATGIQPLTRPLVLPTAAAAGVLLLLEAIARLYLTVTLPVVVGLFVVYLGAYALIVLRLGGIEEEEVMLVNSAEEQLGVDLEPVKRVARRFM